MRKDHWPPRWDQRRGKIYYRVRKDEQELYGVKDFYFLGATETEAFIKWYGMQQHESTIPKTIAAAVGMYMGHRRYAKLKPKTQKDYLNYLIKIRDTFGKMKPRNLRPAHCYEMLRRNKPRQGNMCLAVLSNVMVVAIERGAIDRNPCTEVKKNPIEARDRYVTDDELDAFLNYCTPFLKSWVDLKVITGMRQGQMRQLHMSSWDGERLHVQAAKKGREIIYEGPDLITAMRQVLSVRASRKVGSVYIFPNRRGAMYTEDGFRNLWQYAMASYLKANPRAERFTEHDLRAKMVSDSPDTQSAQRRAGHRSQSTTKRNYERKPQLVEVLKR